MKLFKKILATFLAAAILVALPGIGTLTVSPAEPHTYSVKYIPEKGEWRVQQLSSWDSSRENGNMDYLWGNLQDGDSLVILGDENSPAFGDLKIEKKLANLTLFAVTSSIIVYAQQNISEIYVLKGTVASLNGSYDTVYVYDNSACNVNNDVKKLQISGETSMKMSVTALGKVDFCQIDNRGNVLATMYNVAPGTLKVVDGENKTDAASYSASGNTQPDVQPVVGNTASQPAGTTSTASQPANTASQPAGTSPKTGEDFGLFYLFAAAVFCFAGSMALRKKASL